MKKSKDSILVFCPIRKSFYVLTPEEWVRQNWIQYLMDEFGLEPSQMALEYPIEVNGQRKRADLIVFKKDKAFLLLECKAYDVPISNDHLEQIAMYNHALQTQYNVLSNGLEHFYFTRQENEYVRVKELSL